jgi:hypothetical protein
LLETPIERYFLPCGVAGLLIGILVTAVSFGLSLSGWPIERLWLYLSASALLILVGLQLVMWWLIMSVLAELAERNRGQEG